MRYYLTAVLLGFVLTASAYNVSVVTTSNGSVNTSTTASAGATVTLTVAPDAGYYITASDITITQTGSGNMAQTRTVEPDIAAVTHPTASSIDAEGKGTYTFTMPVSNVKIEATFRQRTVVEAATVTLSATSFTYNGSNQRPTISSVKKDATTFLASESTNGFGDYEPSFPTSSITATESPYTVTVTFRGKYSGTATAQYNINQASISDVTIASVEDQTYTGSPIEPTPTVTLNGYTLIAGTDFCFSYDTDHTNVADGKAIMITGLNGNFNTGTKTQTYNIKPKSISDVAIAAISDQVYTGGAIEPEPVVTDNAISTAPLVKGTDYTVGYSDNNTNVTTAESPVTITITGKGNYDSSTTKTATFKIVKAASSVVTPPAIIENLAYTGSAQDLITVTEVAVTGGEMQYSLDDETYSTAIPQGTDAKNYTVYYKVVGDANHQDSAPATLSVGITKASASVTTAPTAKTGLVYNGEEQELITAGTATNGTMQYSLDNQIYATTIPKGKEAKEYTVYYKVMGDANHNDSEAACLPATIGKKEITISGITASDKTYDGNTNATLSYSSATFTGLMEGDNLMVSATGTFDNANAGTGKTVTVSGLTLGGTSVDNYRLATSGQQSSTTAAITAAALDASTLNGKITLSSTKLGYTGNPVAPTVTIDGMTEGTDFEVKYKSGTAAATTEKPTDYGTYTIVITGKGNYSGDVETGKTFQIDKAASAIATEPSAKAGLVYNGEEQELITAGTGTNGTMHYSLDNQIYATTIPKGKEAKEYTVYYKVMGDANHSDTESSTLKVTIAAQTVEEETVTENITVNTGTEPIVYNGKEQTPTVTIEGMTEGTDCIVKYKNKDGNVSAEKPTNPGTYTIVIEMKGNYSGEIVTDKTFTIAEAEYKDEAGQQWVVETATDEEGNPSTEKEVVITTLSAEVLSGEEEVPATLTGSDGETYNVVGVAAEAFDNMSAGTIVYLPKGVDTTKPVTNVVNGDGTCSKLVLTNVESFSTPKKLTVDEVEYQRAITVNEVFTCCLPYDLTLPSGVQAYTLGGENGNTAEFDEISGKTLTAYKPYLLKATSVAGTRAASSVVDLGKETVTIAVGGDDESETKGNLKLFGTVKGLTNAEGITAGAFAFQTDETWKMTASSDAADAAKLYIKAFRAYLAHTGGSTTGAISSLIRPSSSGEDDEPVTGIDYIRTTDNDGTEQWYDLNGHRIERPQGKGIYIKNGKKTVVR